jgi:hypothetical protein
MCLATRNSIIDEAFSPQYSLTLWSHSREKHFAFCLWISRYECLLTYEGKKETVSWAFDQEHHVLDFTRIGIYA